MAIRNQYNPESIPHPGITLSEKLSEMEMGPKEFALRSGKPEKTIIAILSGKSAITPDMAIQFEMVTKIPATYWMNHQGGYDEYIARIKRQKEIKAAHSWSTKFPVDEMIDLGWLPKLKNDDEKTNELLSYFGFASHKAWEKYYFKQQLKVAFQISLSESNKPHAISSWLRKGELQAKNLNANNYTKTKFKNALPVLKAIAQNKKLISFEELQQICLDNGVKVVHTPVLKDAPINGATRWIKDTPLIQLSNISKLNDNFWHTFFHEVAHIILHGKKEIFLENLTFNQRTKIKEKEADEFARKWTP